MEIKNFNITILHGIGDQERGYSKKFQKEIEKRVKKLTNKKFRLQFNEIIYADILDSKIIEYTKRELNADVNYKKFRELFNLCANDAMAFEIPSVKKKIVNRISNIDKDVDGYHKIYIAHSLGGIVLFNYLTTIDRNIGTLFTLGSPLALYLQYDTNIKKMKNLLDDPLWINILGSDDIIGKPIFMDEVDYNYITKIGVVGIRQTPISHTSYFGNDGNVIKPIVKRISMLINDNFDKNKYIKYIKSLWNI